MSVDDGVSGQPVPDPATIRAVVELAARAPSLHNTQPWRWRFDGRRLSLFADAARQLSSTDPLGRQLVISCGAMLHHVRTGFADRGWRTDITRVPDQRHPDRLAAIEFRPWHNPPPSIRSLARAIEHRRTDRLALRAPHGWGELLPRLRALTAAQYARLDVLDESVRPELTALSREFATLRGHDLFYDTELHWWTGHSEDHQGIPRSALASDAEFARVGVGRVFPPGPRTAHRDHLTDRARLVVLSAVRDSVPQWLRIGEALSAVLLECTAADLATCALTNITELPAGRDLLTGLISSPGIPQVVVRIGTVPADNTYTPPPTPRRPVAEILTLAGGKVAGPPHTATDPDRRGGVGTGSRGQRSAR
ncbi:Acg family FMN-binding oxidoreductase [Nocardia sp. CA-151230]|uniref:Acg family FMN-binding oxidoreductase n=1 Tax=Nocardia sp. CA-151230 TaxID=3239982 RepID=UPI003D8B93F0